VGFLFFKGNTKGLCDYKEKYSVAFYATEDAIVILLNIVVLKLLFVEYWTKF
jgi:hypothetical protein